MARRLPELPLIHEAFSRGELSYAKVRALTRVATAENEEELLELASFMTAAQLERSVRAYRRVTTAEACEQQEDAYLSVFWEPDGSLEIRGRLAPEDGALFLRALDAVRDAKWNERRGSAEPRPARQASNAEALVAVAEAALANPDESRPGGERYQVVLHADEAVLSDDGEGGCELEDGSALSPETARRIACDASIVRNGRKARTIPPALQEGATRARPRLPLPRLREPPLPGRPPRPPLGERRRDDGRQPRAACRRHHRLVHEGGWHVDRRLRFHDRWGQLFPAVPRLPRGHPDELVAQQPRAGDRRSDARAWRG